MKKCPKGYVRSEKTSTCWAECPIEFPVECGMECIRQNDDCGREVLYKVGSVFNVGINGVIDNWFGKFSEMAKGVRTAVMCSCMIVGELRALNLYIRSIKAADPEASQDKILAMLYQSNAVVVELPITIKLCLGGKATCNRWLADRIMSTTQYILAQVLAHDDSIIASWQRFKAFMKGANFTAPPEQVTQGEIGYLKDALRSNSTCGHDLQGFMERTWSTAEALREPNPDITEDELRVKIQDTDIFKSDIATKLRKTFGVVINDLITTGKSDNGTSYKAMEYAYQVVNQGLNFWVVTGFDMSGVSSFISDSWASDDGTHPDTLGLNMIQKAFKNTTMSWPKKGGGQVIHNFTSTDTKNVTVNIISGGDKIDEIDVVAGGTATCKSTVEKLGGRTLYLDRWRPGFFGLPGTGGAEGGHLDLDVRLNQSNMLGSRTELLCPPKLTASLPQVISLLLAGSLSLVVPSHLVAKMSTLESPLPLESSMPLESPLPLESPMLQVSKLAAGRHLKLVLATKVLLLPALMSRAASMLLMAPPTGA
ncbi:hypothetical protein PHYSODRAFT_259300 [Phytophthora sojae]|uniref:Uncharacterized protein n=1 Tax=Phytophthora sojae (strain P6497) TaxID=1094619 RepID=G4ZT77_PHYSP|nr:hypothetical protein PHYSODRAFT_259300 [Phytophthora sojae]EGZ13109.1 hypothetical protein PHYSODRAFT_259300 [Phytophthora sojae]|eukprot:XP_009530538.1 hypothetical protein PHYSODRAFT_259300 [Phytophthora sojae]